MLATRSPRRVYVDTSAWIAFLVREATAPQLTRWLEGDHSQLLTALWTRTELASALAIKSRRGEMSQAQVSTLVGEFERWVTAGMRMLQPDASDFMAAATLCQNVRSGLRAGDALHLAVAARCQASHLLTLDADMRASALAMGLECIVLTE